MSDPTPPISYPLEASSYPQVFTVARPARRRYWVHALLLLTTFATTLIVGTQIAFNYRNGLPAFEFGVGWMPLFHPLWVWHHPSLLLSGLPFAVTLMAILMAHEMGHYLLCEKYGVYATLPFFIPAPTLIGTMGAFIRIKSPIRSRQALFDIGIAGPIAGFVAAIPFLFIGLLLSRPITYPMETGYEIGFPLVFHLAYKVTSAVGHQAVPLSRLSLHPIAVAAWVGMFATALNLIPGGQLDGGHIVYAVSPYAHRRVTITCIVVLSLLGLVGIVSLFTPGPLWAWPTWLLWALVLGVTGWRHPSVPIWPGLDRTRLRLAWVALLLLILTFLPTPFVGGRF